MIRDNIFDSVPPLSGLGQHDAREGRGESASDTGITRDQYHRHIVVRTYLVVWRFLLVVSDMAQFKGALCPIGSSARVGKKKLQSRYVLASVI